ncbi:hypothetical protein RRG08_027173 [Elysia crispata]|uniref:Globin n=1 Tax=Elysia crispata TaxID=231223 RepID=A0AAE1EAA7_9GAST|nr:hypothetical protein RRG08_027173 [Elysia crispata]
MVRKVDITVEKVGVTREPERDKRQSSSAVMSKPVLSPRQLSALDSSPSASTVNSPDHLYPQLPQRIQANHFQRKYANLFWVSLLSEVAVMGALTSCCSAKSLATLSDPVTGLTKKDVLNVRETWKQMEQRKIILSVGAENFVTLFEENPHMIQYFETFSMADTKSVASDKLVNHALTFMKGMRLYLDYIDAPDILIGLLHTISLAHLQRLIRTEDMQVLAVVFIETLKLQLGRQFFTKEVEKSWTDFFLFLNSVYQQVEEKVTGINYRRQRLAAKKQLTSPIILWHEQYHALGVDTSHCHGLRHAGFNVLGVDTCHYHSPRIAGYIVLGILAVVTV